jgi:hypothetical protein
MFAYKQLKHLTSVWLFILPRLAQVGIQNLIDCNDSVWKVLGMDQWEHDIIYVM